MDPLLNFPEPTGDGADLVPVVSTSFDYRPKIVAGGFVVGPDRPPAVANASEIPGHDEAFRAGIEAMQAAENLKKIHTEKLAVVRKFDDERKDLVRRAKSGESIKPGAAGKLERDRADAVADALLAEDAATEAQVEVKLASNRMKTVLRRELNRYAARLLEDSIAAASVAAKAKAEAGAREVWHHNLAMTITNRELEIPDLTALLGIKG